MYKFLFLIFFSAGVAFSSNAIASAACMIPATQASKLFANKNDVMLIDVRSLKEYNKLHVHNSINMTDYILKRKKHLKNKPLLLIDRGHNQNQIVSLCENMKKSGFKHVKVIEGGLYAWLQTGAKLVGNEAEHKNLYLLSARELNNKTSAQKYRVLNLSKQHENDFQRDFKQVENVKNLQQLKRILKSVQNKSQSKSHIKSKKKSEPNSRYLIATDNAQQSVMLLDYIRKNNIPDTVLLKGGAEQYCQAMKMYRSTKPVQRLSTNNLPSCN